MPQMKKDLKNIQISLINKMDTLSCYHEMSSIFENDYAKKSQNLIHNTLKVWKFYIFRSLCDVW